MEASSGLATPHAPEKVPVLRRVHYRHPVHSLVYATLDNGNGGILRNLSQDGAAIQAVAALRPGQTVRMRFDLFHPKIRVDVQARVHWANSSGQAGVVFTDLSPSVRRQLNDWIFRSLFRGMEPSGSILTSPPAAEDLILSASPRPPIRVAPAMAAPAPAAHAFPTAAAVAEPQLFVSWWPQPISAHSLAKLMDVLILLSAVLLFFCVFLAIAQTIPPWPATLALIAGVAGFFTALYWWICAWVGCETVGAQLARIALPDSVPGGQESQVRFR
jgi:hypothetical protein